MIWKQDVSKGIVVKGTDVDKSSCHRASSSTGWQPIASAPKDGTPVLVCELNGWRCVAQFENSEWRPWMPVKIQCEPTHWMPLPAPPQEPQP